MSPGRLPEDGTHASAPSAVDVLREAVPVSSGDTVTLRYTSRKAADPTATVTGTAASHPDATLYLRVDGRGDVGVAAPDDPSERVRVVSVSDRNVLLGFLVGVESVQRSLADPSTDVSDSSTSGENGGVSE